MKCFYHKSDLDGHCSGAIVKLKYQDCEMIGVDYDDDLSTMAEMGLIDIQDGETVFVVDFSFGVEDMSWLKENTDLVWVDHHKSALEKLEWFECKGKREIGKAGCELTMEYLYPEVPMPISVRLLGRYDVWDHADNRVLPFQYGMRSFENTFPESLLWVSILNPEGNFIPSIIEKGQTILDYERKQNEIYAKGMSFESDFEGYRAICLNKAFSNSKIFDSVYDPNLHDIMILFGYRAGQYKFSLYCAKPEIDVSAIAVKYGGGGHKGAAGFYSNKLIFDKND